MEKAIGFHVAKSREVALVTVTPVPAVLAETLESIHRDTTLGTLPETVHANIV